MNTAQDINIDKIDTAIRLLKTHLDQEDTVDIVNALATLKEKPELESSIDSLREAFDAYHYQGAILTYAPYIAVLLSDDPFGNG